MTMGKKREDRLVSGLAEALGVAGASRFEVLKAAAEAMGCTVAEDGTLAEVCSILMKLH
jgi:hypothetical protein